MSEQDLHIALAELRVQAALKILSDDALLTEEAARLLGVSSRTLQRMRSAGEIHCGYMARVRATALVRSGVSADVPSNAMPSRSRVTRRYTASLEKHKGRYNARFYEPETRRRVTHSLGASDKQIATRRLMEFTRACDTGEYDPIVRDGYEFGALPLEATINR